jgi:glycyl-tRNA synthetase alpha chain
MSKKLSFQEIIFALNKYWSDQGCLILQPYDLEMGAGTLHPATALKCLRDGDWNIAYVQPSTRPADGRYGENPNRLQHYYQYQVVLKPSPKDIQELCLKSLKAIGIEVHKHDIRFVEDDWENPTIGASGLGWELWCDGMEVLQFTYMQQIGGIEFEQIPVELTYGLERLAMYIQEVDHFKEIIYSPGEVKYGEIFLRTEREFSQYSLEKADTEMLFQHFEDIEKECKALLEANLAEPAYHHCLKASHLFNLLDARSVISVTERAAYISRIRNLAKSCCKAWLEGC